MNGVSPRGLAPRGWLSDEFLIPGGYFYLGGAPAGAPLGAPCGLPTGGLLQSGGGGFHHRIGEAGVVEDEGVVARGGEAGVVEEEGVVARGNGSHGGGLNRCGPGGGVEVVVVAEVVVAEVVDGIGVVEVVSDIGGGGGLNRL